MTYDQALAFWFSRINYEQRSPKPGDLKLDRMRALLRLLGDPQERLRIIHVAGSKGKGSTAAMLAAILTQAGYRTGLFTSPHLCSVEERLQVDGVPISPAELTGLIGEIREAVRSGPLPTEWPTFFEIATALGFLHFVRRRVDVAVIEVGLGGRFDSTNVCQPLVAVITSISIDHTQQLGSRLGSIAREKAGIIKPRRPAISGATAPEARDVIAQVCLQRQAPLRQLGGHFHYRYEPGFVDVAWQETEEFSIADCRLPIDSQKRRFSTGPKSSIENQKSKITSRIRRPRVQIVTERRAWPVMELNLLGEHQAANAAVVLACVEELQAQGRRISDAAVAAGLAGVRWPARLEAFGGRPLIVLDCAHNLASIQALIETLYASFPAGAGRNGRSRRRLLIFAGSNDKDVAGMLRLLAPHFAHAFLTRYASSPRSVPPAHLGTLLRCYSDLPFTVCSTAREAWRVAGAAAGPDDLVVVTGSVFLAGELRPLLLESQHQPATPVSQPCPAELERAEAKSGQGAGRP